MPECRMWFWRINTSIKSGWMWMCTTIELQQKWMHLDRRSWYKCNVKAWKWYSITCDQRIYFMVNFTSVEKCNSKRKHWLIEKQQCQKYTRAATSSARKKIQTVSANTAATIPLNLNSELKMHKINCIWFAYV